ncbi:Uncharacterized protein FWK35_00023521 [Aphis craccivora]|uniref:Uncharacterized protein n=1 Tax=Aphis craccivora TaxID=307492 RepID=A0A6G0YL52_APHCR|nr:Uncharacterized protein FWK35_00023521 [Aphis craccivora]
MAHTIDSDGVRENRLTEMTERQTFAAAKRTAQQTYLNGRCTHIDSERSDECIDFTMMCVCVFFFFVSLYSITSRNNAPISNYGGGFRCKSEYPWCIIEFSKKSRKTKKKVTEKREFLRKTSFRPNRLFYMVVIQKPTTILNKVMNVLILQLCVCHN